MALQGLPAALKPAAQSVAAAALAERQASVREQLLAALQGLPAALTPAVQAVVAAALAERQASVREQLLAALQGLPAALTPAVQAVVAAALAERQASVREQLLAALQELLAALQELPAAFLVVSRISALAFSPVPPPAQVLLWTGLNRACATFYGGLARDCCICRLNPRETSQNRTRQKQPSKLFHLLSFSVEIVEISLFYGKA